MTTFLSRFESKINRHSESGCWLWTGATTGRGKYRHGSVGLPRLRATAKASRVAWELYRGRIPDGLQVLHSCDNPLCVNPEHLFLGTHAENMADMKEKGRSTHGEKSARAKLTREQVFAIRQSTEAHTVMAKQFGVPHHAIRQIRKGTTWPDVPMPVGIVYERARRPQTEETKAKLREHWRQLPDSKRYSTHCARGHPLSGDNLGANRRCRACGAANKRARRALKRQDAADE